MGKKQFVDGVWFQCGDIDKVFETVGFSIEEWMHWGTYDEYIQIVETGEETVELVLLTEEP